MTIETIQRRVQTASNMSRDAYVQTTLDAAVRSLRPNVPRLRLEWVGGLLRDCADCAACRDESDVADILRDAANDLCKLWEDYHV